MKQRKALKLHFIRHILLFCTLLCPPLYAAAGDVKLRVAVASNFVHAGKSLFAAFEQNADVSIQMVSGSSGKLLTQIRQGAPFDVFLAADQASISTLKTDKLIYKDSSIVYAIGALVLWHPGYAELQLPAELTRLNGVRLSHANPTTAPYGQAAIETLKQLGRSGFEPGTIVQGQSIGQTYQFVASGNTALGFIALSQVLASKQPPNSWWIIPSTMYTPLAQSAAILKRVEKPVLNRALAFMHFLQSNEARDIMAGFGYAHPSGPSPTL